MSAAGRPVQVRGGHGGAAGKQWKWRPLHFTGEVIAGSDTAAFWYHRVLLGDPAPVLGAW